MDIPRIPGVHIAISICRADLSSSELASYQIMFQLIPEYSLIGCPNKITARNVSNKSYCLCVIVFCNEYYDKYTNDLNSVQHNFICEILHLGVIFCIDRGTQFSDIHQHHCFIIILYFVTGLNKMESLK